jgi:hypothetical protein
MHLSARAKSRLAVFDWAFNYDHNEDRWNPPHLISKEPYLRDPSQKVVPPKKPGHPIPENAKVDIMLTHGPPWRHLDTIASGDSVGCPQLLQALDRIRPRLHCFGHIHEAWGCERVTWSKKDNQETGNGSGVLGEIAEPVGHLPSAGTGKGVQTPWDADVVERRAAFVDVSNSSPTPLEYGKETLLVNPSIMTLKYQPDQAGWLVDLELPKRVN